MIRILIVDDQPDVLEPLAKYLALKGYSVQMSLDRDASLQIAEKMQPDILLLDHLMPGLSSDDYLNKLRELKLSSHVILVSGGEVPELADPSNVKRFLSKPFTFDAVEAVISECMND